MIEFLQIPIVAYLAKVGYTLFLIFVILGILIFLDYLLWPKKQENKLLSERSVQKSKHSIR